MEGIREYQCIEKEIHEESLEEVKRKFPVDEEFFELSDFFSIFGDTTRLKILYALGQKSLCVCDISELLNMTLSAISHQLRVLRESKLVKTKREGKEVYYSLADSHVRELLDIGIHHMCNCKEKNVGEIKKIKKYLFKNKEE